MNAKRTRTRGTRRPTGGRRAPSKKPVKAKFWTHPSADPSARSDDQWKAEIKIYAENGRQIAALILRPTPPKPPITFTRICRWIGRAGNP